LTTRWIINYPVEDMKNLNISDAPPTRRIRQGTSVADWVVYRVNYNCGHHVHIWSGPSIWEDGPEVPIPTLGSSHFCLDCPVGHEFVTSIAVWPATDEEIAAAIRMK
jgi:hypothetical protein